MFKTSVRIAFLILVLAALTFSGASAQTPAPSGPGSCAPETPCADPVSGGAAQASGQFAATTALPAAAAATASSGFGLATAVMVLLVLALLYALVAALLIALGQNAPLLPSGASALIPILSVLGLGVAFYLTYVETQNVAAVCGPVGDCNAVQSSPYAKLFNFLPVGLLGLLGYVGILATWGVQRLGRGSLLARLAPFALLGMALFGVLFTIYLTYLELFVIHAVCIWCLTSAVLMAAVLVLAVQPAAEALMPAEAEA